MREPKTKDLGTLDAVENGAAVDVSYMYEYDKTVTISGTFTATVKIQSSADGTNWVQEGADVTAAAVRTISTKCKYLRTICSAYTSGSAVGQVFGIETKGM